ncbi:hypothetical protein TNCV_437571 [Trichonephila clavipes]|nr:hypothetical protein TNCV_437571 [Trichonephila clavipes]
MEDSTCHPLPPPHHISSNSFTLIANPKPLYQKFVLCVHIENFITPSLNRAPLEAKINQNLRRCYKTRWKTTTASLPLFVINTKPLLLVCVWGAPSQAQASG